MGFISVLWAKEPVDNGLGNEDAQAGGMDRPLPKHPLWKWKKRAPLVALLIAGGIAIAYANFGVSRTLSISSSKLTVSTVHNGNFAEYVPMSAAVEPRETVYLDAIDGGQVAKVFVEEGSVVTAGQPLLQLNNASLQLEVINSEAQLSEQINRLTTTKLAFQQSSLSHRHDLIDIDFQIESGRRHLARLEALVGTGAIKRADIEDQKLEVERLQRRRVAVEEAIAVDDRLQKEQIQQLDTAVKHLTGNLSIARVNLDDLVVKAPISGHLTALDAHPGESKQPGQRLGQVDKLDEFKLVAHVDEYYLSRVTEGQDAVALLDGTEAHLKVAKIYPEVTDRQFRVDFEFDGHAPASVRRGQSLQLKLQLSAPHSELLINNGPFYDETAGQWAFVLTSNRTAEKRPIRLGKRNPESIEVLSGLQPKDQVITSSYSALKEFDRIDIQSE